MHRTFAVVLALIGVLGALAAAPVQAQEKARIEEKLVHSAALEGNLEGNSAERGVLVVTPPGYDEHPDRHYPVIYFLHGYLATPQMYEKTMAFEEAVDEAAAAGNEVIMVIPDGYSKLKGGFYSSGPTVGDYQAFVGEELVKWVDANYRSIPRRESRGLSGHSMGGYGTMRLGMKYPETFSSIYAMSACCLSPMEMTPELARQVEATSPDKIADADFATMAALSTLATWAPDPTRPPYFIDTGLRADGTIDPLVNAKLSANSILAMVPQYLPALKSMTAIGLEVGEKDFLLKDDTALHAELTLFGIAHQWETYDGDHGNRIRERIRSKMLPFFAAHLARESK